MNKIGIIGAGTMGTGIALVSALAGYEVHVYDIAEAYLEKSKANLGSMMEKSIERGKLTTNDAQSAKERLSFSVTFDDLRQSDLVIEAAVENLTTKHEIFEKLGEICGTDTILASNTSSFAITAIASVMKNPERVIGLHFFNPAHIMKLVEIIRGQSTSDDVVARAEAFIRKIGKTPAHVKDTPGLIVNRVARNYYGESLRLLSDGVASHEQIDRIWKSNGMPMGPFQLMDMIGIDVNLAVTESVYSQYFGEPRFRPHLIQQKMVEAKLLGKKSGKGFYDYSK